MAIGDIEVTVIPDARGFWLRFQDQTRGEAEAQGRRQGDEFRRGFEGARNPVITPTVNSAPARAQLQQLSQQGSRSSGGLLKALIPLAPALVPLSGAAAAAGGALAGLGIAGVLAVKGIQNEIKKTTPLGVQFAASLGQAKSAVATLEKTASRGVLDGLQSSVAKLSVALPGFNNFIADSSKNLGEIGSNVVGGLVSGFTTFAPLLSQVEAEFVKLSAAFEKFASGPAGAKFAKTLADDFKQVVPIIESLAVNVGHLIAAFAPVGGTVLAEIGALSAAISHIPIPILTAAATAFIAFKTATAISGGLTAASVAITRLGRSAAGLGALGTGLGVIGTGLARVVPYAAAVVGLHFAADAASKATDSWATSSNRLQFAVHQTASALSDLTRGNVGGFISKIAGPERDAAEQRRNSLIDLNKQIDEVRKTISAPLSFAAAISGNAQAKSYLATITKVNQISGVYAAQIKNTPIAEQVALYGKQASSLDRVQTALGKFLTAGDKTKYVYKGVTVGTEAWNKALAENGNSTAAAEGAINGQIDALQVVTGRTDLAASSAANLSKAVATAQSRYKLTADQVDTFTAILGISIDRVASGAITTREFTRAIGLANRVVSSAGPAFSGYLAEVAKYNTSTKTATDKANLFAAALHGLVGDTLTNTNLNLQAASATEGVANAIAQNSAAISANGRILGQATKTAQGYVILQPKLTEGGLAIAGALQQQADAAIAAASGLYQTELRTRGQGAAVKDATGLYLGYRTQLQDTLTQVLGNADAAKKLTDRYLGVPKNVKTFAKLFGKGDIEGAISSLTTTLGHFSRIIATAIARLNTDDFSTRYRTVAAQLNALDGKVITPLIRLQVTGNVPSGNKVTPGLPPGLLPVANGASAAGSASWTKDGKLPPGYSTVGERGWELARTDASGRTEIYDHVSSMAMTSMPDKLPGFAGGTLPSLVTQPTSSSASAAASSAQQKASAAATAARDAALQAVKDAAAAVGQAVSIPFDVATVGIARVSETLAHASAVLSREVAKGLISPKQQQAAEAQLQRLANLANRQLTALRLKIKGSDLAEVKKSLTGTASDIRAAFGTIFTDINRSGGNSRLVASLKTLEAGLIRTIAKRDKVKAALGDPPSTATTAYERLSTALDNFKAERASVADAVKGSFDITSAGANPVTGKVTGDGLLAQSKQNRNLVHKFVADAKKLKGLINDTYWAQLVGDGPAALPQIDALLSLSKADRKTIDDNQKAVAGAGASLGTTAANQLYGTQLADAKSEVQTLRNRLHADNLAIGRKLDRVGDRLAAYANRAVVLQANGREIARVVNTENNKSKART